MKSDRIHIFEVRDGDEVIARFTQKTPADRKRKELRKSGRKVKLYSLFVRKFVPVEEKALPKGMEYWKGRIPWQIAPEGASQLRMSWEHIQDVFYIGSYRDGEVCKPYDRTEDLSIQPNGDHLALCYHSIPDGKTYLILDRLDWISVKQTCVEFSGIAADGYMMMFTMEIAGSRDPYVPKIAPFRKGWYSLGNGALFYIDESDDRLTKEQGSDRLVGMFPYVVVYPGFTKGDYSVGKGHIPLHDGEKLEDYVRIRLGTELGEYIETDRARDIAGAFRTRNTPFLKKLIERGGMGPFARVISCNRRPRRWRIRR